MMPGMARFAALAASVLPSVLASGLALSTLAGCSKSAGNQDKVTSPPSSGGQEVAMPQGSAPTMGGAAKAAPVEAAPAPGADDDRLRLHPEEGTLAVEAPADAKAGAEAVAKIIVKPGKGFHVNTEYPIKLTLTPPSGVALAKADFAAGGHDKGK